MWDPQFSTLSTLLRPEGGITMSFSVVPMYMAPSWSKDSSEKAVELGKKMGTPMLEVSRGLISIGKDATKLPASKLNVRTPSVSMALGVDETLW